jgi:hypothetical protein
MLRSQKVIVHRALLSANTMGLSPRPLRFFILALLGAFVVVADANAGPAVDALIVKLRGGSFYGRLDAVKALDGMGADAVPAIPALMDILGDERTTEDPRYTLSINGHSALSLSNYTRNALEKIIRQASGFGFDYARNILLAPLPEQLKYVPSKMNPPAPGDNAASTDFMSRQQKSWTDYVAKRDGQEKLNEIERVKQANLASVLPAYGEVAIPVLVSLVNAYGDSHQASISRVQEAGAWALGDFGEASTGLLCDVLAKHPSWSARRAASMRLLKNKSVKYSGNEDHAEVRQTWCRSHQGSD